MDIQYLPDLMLNGLGAQRRAIPFAVLSVYNGVSCKNGCASSGNSNSSSSSGRGSAAYNASSYITTTNIL
jgi:hypothetical protein